jgi:hypothetical protein
LTDDTAAPIGVVSRTAPSVSGKPVCCGEEGGRRGGWGGFLVVFWIESLEKRAGRAGRGRSLSYSYAMGLDCGWLEARAEVKPPKKFRPEDFEKFLNRQAQHAVSR